MSPLVESRILYFEGGSVTVESDDSGDVAVTFKNSEGELILTLLTEDFTDVIRHFKELRSG